MRGEPRERVRAAMAAIQLTGSYGEYHFTIEPERDYQSYFNVTIKLATFMQHPKVPIVEVRIEALSFAALPIARHLAKQVGKKLGKAQINFHCGPRQAAILWLYLQEHLDELKKVAAHEITVEAGKAKRNGSRPTR